MKFRSRKQVVLIVLSAAIATVVATETFAQVRDRDTAQSERPNVEARSERGKSPALYPQAKRQEPETLASSRLSRKLQRMIDAYNSGTDYAQARTLADEILADNGANRYERSLAAQLAAQSAYSLDDNTAAEHYLKQALAGDGLDNNGHYQSMLMLAQLQLLDESRLQEGLTTLVQYFEETESQRPEDLILKGQALYKMGQHAEAAVVVKQVVEDASDPKDSWLQLLMACYMELNQTGEAIAIAEQLSAKNASDKSAQMNLVSTYLRADRNADAVQILERLRAAGQFTEERDYRQLYVVYANMEGRESDVIDVIDEGLEKKILQPDYQTYLALAQSYYYSGQVPQAIENWQKAAPLSENGETFLNLAKALWQEDRIAEAKQAARQALDKGVRNRAEAERILELN